MESKTGEKKLPGSSSSLGPGFRFHPTDEELVQYYLRRKVCGKAFRFDAISDVDVYKTEPWDLPHMSKLKTRDLEWYFFSLLDKKYGNGARTNRATEKGYWKTTGKDRAVYHKNQIVGMKKTLVYHFGRAPKGQRTNWVMHEYRLSGSALEIAGDAQDAFVVCRIFQKSGSGPKNGEQYGAPLVEEEWDNDELELDHQSDATEEVDFGIDAGLNSHHIQQILGSDFQSNAAPLLLTSQCAGDQHCELQLSDNENIYNMPISYDMDDIPIEQVNIGKCSMSGNSDDLNFLLDEPFLDSVDKLPNGDEGFIEANDLSNPTVSDDKNIYDMNAIPIEQVNIGKCSESGNSDDNFLLDEPFLDSFDKLPNGDEGFIEANDLSNPTVSNTTAFDMFEEYLTYFDANDDSSLYFACDPDMMFGSDDLVCGQTLLPQKETGEAIEVATLPGGQIIDNNTSAVVSSSDKPESVKYQSEMQNPFVEQASQMLGNIHAPPAFAAEFPSKDTVVRLNSAICPSGTVRSYGKDENFNIVVSFGFSQGDDGFSSLESSVRIVPGKTTAATVTRGWLYFMFFWVLILYMSFRIGTYICAN